MVRVACLTSSDDDWPGCPLISPNLRLTGLTSLSEMAAKSLSKREGGLELELDELPASAAEILRQHPSFQDDDEDWDEDNE